MARHRAGQIRGSGVVVSRRNVKRLSGSGKGVKVGRPDKARPRVVS